MDMSYSNIMEFLHSTPMPVAVHFMVCSQKNGELQEDNGSSEMPAFGNDDIISRSFVGVVCETCFAYFTDDMELWLHVRHEHGKDRKLACSVPGCGKRFLAREMRTEHMAHHRGVKFVQNTIDDIRRLVQVVVRPHTCELCGRLSANQKASDKHLANKHPKSRRYACGVCTLLMRDVPTLARHVRRHHATELTDVKRNLRCDVCAKLFGNRMMLQKHRPIHGFAVGYDVFGV